MGVMKVLHDLGLASTVDAIAGEAQIQMLKQNAFYCPGKSGGPALGVWLTPSFVSHSCFPTCSWNSDQDGTFVLSASRVIAAGEELTISYISQEDLDQPVSHRRELLAESKGFFCNCARCAGN